MSGFGEKSINNLLDAIDKSRNIDLSKVNLLTRNSRSWRGNIKELSC